MVHVSQQLSEFCLLRLNTCHLIQRKQQNSESCLNTTLPRTFKLMYISFLYFKTRQMHARIPSGSRKLCTYHLYKFQGFLKRANKYGQHQIKSNSLQLFVCLFITGNSGCDQSGDIRCGRKYHRSGFEYLFLRLVCLWALSM